MSITQDFTPAAGKFKKEWGWFLALGISMVLLGMVALGATSVVTLATVWFFGFLIIFGGVLHIGHAFAYMKWKGFWPELLLGILYLLCGVILCANPLAGSAVLTLFLGIAFLFNGGARATLSLMHREQKGWGMMLFSGIISVILGVLILAHWPVISLFIIGLYVAVELICSGVFWLTLAIAAAN